MADISIKVLQPAESYALLNMDELKVILNLPLTDVSEDPQLQMWIDQYSDVVATMCNRVFAYEIDRNQAQRNTIEGSGKITVDVNAPKGTNVGAEASGLFKEVAINRQTQMEPAHRGPAAGEE
jgi:hypothetical protein